MIHCAKSHYIVGGVLENLWFKPILLLQIGIDSFGGHPILFVWRYKFDADSYRNNNRNEWAAVSLSARKSENPGSITTRTGGHLLTCYSYNKTLQ